MTTFASHCRRAAHAVVFAAAAALSVSAMSFAPAAAQIRTVDPNTAIDGDLSQPAPQSGGTSWQVDEPGSRYEDAPSDDRYAEIPAASPQPGYAGPAQAEPVVPAQSSETVTYAEDDLIGAAEGLFGKGAEGLARMIEDILSKQGEPNAYIVGREGGGALILGVRYGSGTLYHKVEGNRPVYWTGPSIGFDAGANAGNTFVLVYNLDDTEELYERYPAGEGSAYLVGGFNASYMRKGDVVLIPIRVGAGLRLGVNAGYMRFSHKQRWLPF